MKSARTERAGKECEKESTAVLLKTNLSLINELGLTINRYISFLLDAALLLIH